MIQTITKEKIRITIKSTKYTKLNNTRVSLPRATELTRHFGRDVQAYFQGKKINTSELLSMLSEALINA